MRKLASIQKILDIQPILGADNILLATIQGWKVIISKKDNFNIGDNIIYLEIDSILPPKPEFEFLKSKNYRIKTWKLNKFNVISQGIVFPLSLLPSKNYAEGEDVTALMGVTQYIPDTERDPDYKKESKSNNFIIKKLRRFSWFRSLEKKLKDSSDWPSFIVKTDETRIQNLSNLYPLYVSRGPNWYFSEKLDGQSATYFVKTRFKFFRNFGVCSRNLWLKTKHPCSWWSIAESLEISKKLKTLKDDFYIQGEIIGSSVQGNKYKRNSYEFYVFNAYNLTKKERLHPEDLTQLCVKLGLPQVPFIGKRHLPSDMQDLINEANGTSTLWETPREGFVVRGIVDNQLVSFKVISPEFLLKE